MCLHQYALRHARDNSNASHHTKSHENSDMTSAPQRDSHRLRQAKHLFSSTTFAFYKYRRSTLACETDTDIAQRSRQILSVQSCSILISRNTETHGAQRDVEHTRQCLHSDTSAENYVSARRPRSNSSTVVHPHTPKLQSACCGGASEWRVCMVCVCVNTHSCTKLLSWRLPRVRIVTLVSLRPPKRREAHQ